MGLQGGTATELFLHKIKPPLLDNVLNIMQTDVMHYVLLKQAYAINADVYYFSLIVYGCKFTTGHYLGNKRHGCTHKKIDQAVKKREIGSPQKKKTHCQAKIML